jgi:hypothetical protein
MTSPPVHISQRPAAALGAGLVGVMALAVAGLPALLPAGAVTWLVAASRSSWSRCRSGRAASRADARRPTGSSRP